MYKKSFWKKFLGLSISSILALAVAITPLGAYYYGNNSQNLPQVTNVEVTAKYINPQTQTLYVSYHLADDAKVTVRIMQNGKTLKTLLTDDFQGAGFNTFSWDGRDKTGKFVPDGTYTIVIEAQNNAGTSQTTQVVHANYIPAATTQKYHPYKDYSQYKQAYNKYDYKNYYDDPAYKAYQAAYPKAKYQPYTYPDYDYTDYTDYNEPSYAPQYDGPAYVLSHQASKSSFNPYYDQSVAIKYQLSRNAKVTVEILGEGFIARTLTDDIWQAGNKAYSVNWDGRNSSGKAVLAGRYRYRITLDNGNQVYGDIYVANPYDPYTAGTYPDYNYKYKKTYNEPYYNYPKKYSSGDMNVYGEKAEPSVFNPSKESTKISYILSQHTDEVTITVYKGYFPIKTLVKSKQQTSGTNKAYWDGTDSKGHKVDAGVYTIRIEAKDGNSYDAEDIYVEVKHHPKGKNYKSVQPRVTQDSVKPQTFNPYQEETKISYSTTQHGFVSVRIMNGQQIVKSLAYNEFQSEGVHGRLWDGKNQYGQYVNEGPYQYEIHVYNEDGQDTKRGNLVVDYEGMNFQPGYPTPAKVAVKKKAYVASAASAGQYYNNEAQPCAGFIDVLSATKYCDPVIFVKTHGIFNGYNGAYFYPNKAIQRDEAVKVVIETFGLSTVPVDGGTLGFYDVDPYGWYMPYLKAAKTLGIVDGYPNHLFMPYAKVNRAEFTKMFLEAAKNAHGINIPYCNDKPYADTDITWYTDYICYAKKHGLIKTKDPWTFEPGIVITRGQVAEFIYNYFGN